MICFPNAKINLGLNIVQKRVDGYHNLETIFYPIPLEDILEVEIVPSLETDYELLISGINIEGDPERNLVVKAYKLLKENFDLAPIRIHLHKRIPSGAGLGGGSSDAAFMLKLLNTKFELNLSVQELEDYATQLGADCAFFIQNSPTFAEGIGEIFSPINLSLKGYYLYLVKPDLFISTAMAFSEIKPKRPETSLKEIINTPIEEWRAKMRNDFEKGIFKKLPELALIKKSMYEDGAIYAAMSGSGSTIYGLFKDSHGLEDNPSKGKFLLKL